MMIWLLFWTAVSMVAALHQSVGPMVIFATRSRHTYGFESGTTSRPITAGPDPFDLPLLEFQALFRGESRDSKHPLTLEFQAVDGTSDNLFWAVPRIPAITNTRVLSEECLQEFRARVAQTASRAVLTHASMDIRLSLPPSCQAASLAVSAGCPLSLEQTEVVDMRNPNLSSAERQALLIEAGVVPRSPEGDSPSSSNTEASTTRNVLLRRCDGYWHVGYRTGTGPAAPTSGAPGIKPRRNYKGILGKLALKHRLDASKHLTSTAMEPEIAIVMANLGTFRTPTTSQETSTNTDIRRVLDPCCGSSSLLIAAAVCGATTLVGVDLNATAFLGADKEFERHGLTPPLLVQGSVLEPHATTPAFNDTYHTILCDPPYGIGAPILGHVIRTSPERTTTESSPVVSPETIVSAVLELARRTLLAGGRLVMFVPVRCQKGETPPSLATVLLERGCSSEEVRYLEDGEIREDTASPSETARSNCLRLVHGRRQCFSPTFSRWLVVMERVL